MPKINSQIEELIRTSLFLNSGRKKKLLKLLEVASESEKKEIFKTLKTEKKNFKVMVKRFIEEKGEDGGKTLEKLFMKANLKISNAYEETVQIEEEDKMERLIDDLNKQ